MSGLGAPAFTATPIPARAKSTRSPTTLPCLMRLSITSGVWVTRSAGALELIFCIIALPSSKLTMTLWPLARSKAGARSRTADTTPKLVKTTISAARAGPCTNTPRTPSKLAPSKPAVAAFKHLVIVSSAGRLEAAVLARSRAAFEHRDSERLKRIDLGHVLVTPFEPAHCDCLRRQIDDEEPVLLDRRLHLFDLEACGRLRAHAAEERRPAIAIRTERARQDRDHGIGGQIGFAGALDARFADGVQVAADKKRDASPHGRRRMKQPVMLSAPPRLPIRLGLVGCQAAFRLEVAVSFAPLSGAPTRRRRRHIDDVSHVARRHAAAEPSLCLGRHERRARSLECHEAPAIVHQHFGEAAVAQRAERFRNATRPILGGRGSKPKRPVRVWQE